MSKLTLLATTTILLSAGCFEGFRSDRGRDPIGDDDVQVDATAAARARQLFDTNIYPIIAAECAGCHASNAQAGPITGFVDVDPTRAYDRVTGFTALVGDYTMQGAAIVSKIASDHQNITYTSAELAKFDAWLEEERRERGIDDTTVGQDAGYPSPVNLLARFSGCMTYDNFVTANMAPTWGNLGATNNQECQNCHATGGEGFIASSDPQLFFNVISKHSRYLAQYFVPAQNQVVVNATSFAVVSNGQVPHTEHPRFQMQAGLDASNSFLALTNGVASANLCGPPTLID